MTQANLFDPPVRGHRPTRQLAVEPKTHQPVARKTRKLGQIAASIGKENLWTAMLEHYKRGPLTDREMANLLDVDRTTITARRDELVKLRRVHDTGFTRRNPKSGIPNALWGLAAKVLSEGEGESAVY